MKNVLGKNELEWLDVAFPDARLRETSTPDPGSVEMLRQAAVAFARVVFEQCPTSADRSSAIRNIRTAYAEATDSLVKTLPRV